MNKFRVTYQHGHSQELADAAFRAVVEGMIYGDGLDTAGGVDVVFTGAVADPALGQSFVNFKSETRAVEKVEKIVRWLIEAGKVLGAEVIWNES